MFRPANSIPSLSSSSSLSQAHPSSTSPSASRPSTRASRMPPRPRPRPPSPVAMYAAGFGFDAPKQPKPLPILKGKSKANRQSMSQDTINSPTSPSESSSVISGGARSTSTGSSRKSPPKRSFSFTGWLKRSNPNTHQSSPSVSSTSHNRPPKPGVPVDFVPSEAEVKVRQLDKVTRTLGERVPVEFILEGEPHAQSSSTEDGDITLVMRRNSSSFDYHPPPRILRPLPDCPTDDLHSLKSAKSLTGLVVSSSNSSPISANQEYHYTKRSRTLPTLPTIDTTARHSISSDSLPSPSPIAFTDPSPPPLPHSLPKPPISNQAHTHSQKSIDSDPKTVPLLLRIPSTQPTPRSKYAVPRLNSHTRPKTSHGAQDTESRKAQSSSRSHSRPSTAHGTTPTTPAFPDRPDSPFQDSSVPVQAWLSTSWSSKSNDGSIVRRERNQGWSGEWNRSDMQDVIDKLRQLK